MPDAGWLAAIARRPLLGLMTAVIVVALDQWTKQIAVSELEYRIPIMVTTCFDWMLTYNTGAAFSVLADAGGWQRWFLTGIAAAVSVFIVIWLFLRDCLPSGVMWMFVILGCLRWKPCSTFKSR